MLRAGKAPRLALLSLLAVCAASQGAPAGDGLDLAAQTYRDRNGVWVHTALAAFHKALSRRLGLEWTQTYDIMSGASRSLGRNHTGHIDSLHAVDAVTRASARESRHAARGVLHLGDADGRVSAGIYGSRETDYASLAPTLGFSRRFFGGNTTVSADFAWHFDRSRPRPPFQDRGGTKQVASLDFSATQVVTPLLLLSAGGTVTASAGRLGHPYTPTIDADGLLRDESLPGERLGLSPFVRAIQGYVIGSYLGAFDLQLRRYQDDWGLASQAADARWTQNLPRGFSVRLRLRGYEQRGALFTRLPYQGDELYHSADIRLHAFQSLLGGIRIGGGFPEAWENSAFLPHSWDLGYERSVRNTYGDRPGARRTYQLYSPEERYAQDVARLGLHFGF